MLKSIFYYLDKNINYIGLFFLPILVLAIGNYYLSSSFIFWQYDSLEYHLKVSALSEFYSSNLDIIKSVYSNTFVAEYNNFYAIFLYPIVSFFPFSRHLYISSVLLVFFIPVILVLRLFFKETLSIKNNYILFIISFLTIIFVPFISPILQGWPDIFGYIPLIFFYIMYFNSPIEERNYKSIILMSFLFYMPFLIRRIYIYEMIVFTLFVMLQFIYDFIYRKKINKTYLINFFSKYFVFGLLIIIFALIFQYKHIIRILSSSYGNLYVDYQAINYNDHFMNLYYFVGKYYIFCAVLGAILGFFSKYRKITLFFAFNIVTIFFLFNLYQKMGVQHILDTIALGVFVLNIIAILCIINCVKRIELKIIILFFIILVSVFNFLSSIGLKNSNLAKYLVNNKIVPNMIPPVNNSLNEEIAIMQKVDNWFSNKNGNYMVLTHGDYILSINFITYNFYYLNSWNNERNLFYSHLDARDFINENIFRTKYIIMESTGKSLYREQKVVSIPFKEITKNKNNIGKAFKKTDFKYITSSGVEIWIYEKTRDFTKKEIVDFLNEFYNFYPDWRAKYENKIDYFYDTQRN